jgi:SOS-response transcriptional repressor LexA
MDIQAIRRENLTRMFHRLSPDDVTGFSKIIGKSQSATSDLLLGRKSFGEKMARSIEKNAGWPLMSLDAFEEPNVQIGLKLYPDRRGYPVISPVQAGNWREIVDTFPRGSADEYRMASNEYGPHTFALRIVGNSMEPEFVEGDLVFIDPDVRPRPGNFVVAKNHEEEATFKKYRPRGIDANGVEIFELVPLNPDYAVMRSDQQPIKIIGTMMEHTRYRR